MDGSTSSATSHCDIIPFRVMSLGMITHYQVKIKALTTHLRYSTPIVVTRCSVIGYLHNDWFPKFATTHSRRSIAQLHMNPHNKHWYLFNNTIILYIVTVLLHVVLSSSSLSLFSRVYLNLQSGVRDEDIYMVPASDEYSLYSQLSQIRIHTFTRDALK